MLTKLIDDTAVADALGVSRSWVRKQRFNRRHGLQHTLTVDPVLLGSLPRYRQAEVAGWLASLDSAPNAHGGEHA